MMLVEEGRLQIYDPVAKYLPEFAEMKVGTEKASGEGKPTLELSAPARPMTIQDLLRHTSGLTYAEFGKGHGPRPLQGGRGRQLWPEQCPVRCGNCQDAAPLLAGHAVGIWTFERMCWAA